LSNTTGIDEQLHSKLCNSVVRSVNAFKHPSLRRSLLLLIKERRMSLRALRNPLLCSTAFVYCWTRIWASTQQHNPTDWLAGWLTYVLSLLKFPLSTPPHTRTQFIWS